MGLLLAVSGLREMKILKRLRVTPVSPVFVLGVELAIYIVYCAVSLATLSAVALLWGVRLRGSLWAFLGSWVLTMALDPVRRYAGGRRVKGHQAGQHHCLDPLFPHADLFRYNTAH